MKRVTFLLIVGLGTGILSGLSLHVSHADTPSTSSDHQSVDASYDATDHSQDSRHLITSEEPIETPKRYNLKFLQVQVDKYGRSYFIYEQLSESSTTPSQQFYEPHSQKKTSTTIPEQTDLMLEILGDDDYFRLLEKGEPGTFTFILIVLTSYVFKLHRLPASLLAYIIKHAPKEDKQVKSHALQMMWISSVLCLLITLYVANKVFTLF
ncbi:hypothetical protein [Thalassobacillus hwangdonensis]|uniref:Uncharacterized protein n=1 Tax=Thalassobacillus hwangdonensis TaxID=546108 RepID=A0ABW3L0F8_9BACI